MADYSLFQFDVVDERAKESSFFLNMTTSIICDKKRRKRDIISDANTSVDYSVVDEILRSQLSKAEATVILKERQQKCADKVPVSKKVRVDRK